MSCNRNSCSTATTTTTGGASLLSTRTVLNSVTAGYVAGVAGTVIGHPLDSLKVWMQTGQSKILSTLHATTSSTPAISSHQFNNKSSNPSSTAGPQPQQQQRAHHTSSRPTNSVAGSHRQARLSSTMVTSSSASRPSSQHTIRHNPNSNNLWSTTNTAAAVRRSWLSNLRALYAGVAGPLVTVGAIQSLNFAIYDSVRRYLHKDPHTSYLTQDPLSHVAFASMSAGALLAVLTNPLMLVKTQQQTASHTLTYRQAVLMTVRAGHGISGTSTTSSSSFWAVRNLYTGFVPHATVEIAGRGIYYVSYESLKRYLTHEDGLLSLPNRMLAAGVAGIITWSTIFPLDAVRCRMFAATAQQPPQQNNSKSSLSMVSQMWQQSGWRGFYRGFGITLLRAGPVAACVLPIYDLALDRLSTV